MSERSRKILGKSDPILKLVSLIERVGKTKTNVLIIGESGTGKELVARMLHDQGDLKNKPFVPVNCGAIPENLIESELFGHKKGSFTGAVSDKMGLFEVAHNGTLFLDEVGELPLTMQVKLLRAIQERNIRKVGGNDDIKIEVRIIAATNKNLEAETQAGRFREDLYYRLNVIQIKTPPLRERGEDIEFLAKHFMSEFSKRSNKAVKDFDIKALQAIQRYPWPGNVRELENVIERAVTLESGEKIMFENLPAPLIEFANKAGMVSTTMVSPGISGSNRSGASDTREIRLPMPDFSKGPLNLDEILGQLEKTYLNAALEYTGGIKKKAADCLGITFRSIRYRLKKLGVDDDEEER